MGGPGGRLAIRNRLPDKTLAALRLGSLLARALPLSALIRLGQLLGAAIGPRLLPAKAAQLQRHISRVEAAAGLEPLAARRAVEGFGSYGRYWVESLRIPHLDRRNIDRGFSVFGFAKLEHVRAAGYGPILVLPHLGGWEWAAAWLGKVNGLAVTAVVERLEPEEVFDWFASLRSAYGINVVPVGPKAMVELSAAVKRRDVVCLLADRDIGGRGIPVDFFGETTTLPAGPALLSRRTGAPLLPTAVYFRGRQRVGLVGDPIWPDQFSAASGNRAPAGTGGRGINQRIMQEVADRLAELVTRAPEQWHLLEPNWPSDHR